jgi:hypothetical protein
MRQRSAMKLSFLRLLATLCVTLTFGAAARAAELPIIAKARARLGSEAALEGLKSVHYSGSLSHADPRDPTKTITAKVDMVFVKPDKQRIMATYDEIVETTALDGYDGWTRVENRKDPTKFRITPLDAEAVKRLRANTFESLGYFRGLEKLGGRIEDLGVVNKEGVTCQKVAFHHSPKMIFYRYFDVATGRLVLTETENGSTLKESGELMAGGIRFPQSLVTATAAGNALRTVTLTYDKVTVNEVFPAKMFAYPTAKNQ